jgi:hypothetical protein
MNQYPEGESASPPRGALSPRPGQPYSSHRPRMPPSQLQTPDDYLREQSPGDLPREQESSYPTGEVVPPPATPNPSGSSHMFWIAAAVLLGALVLGLLAQRRPSTLLEDADYRMGAVGGGAGAAGSGVRQPSGADLEAELATSKSRLEAAAGDTELDSLARALAEGREREAERERKLDATALTTPEEQQGLAGYVGRWGKADCAANKR